MALQPKHYIRCILRRAPRVSGAEIQLQARDLGLATAMQLTAADLLAAGAVRSTFPQEWELPGASRQVQVGRQQALSDAAQGSLDAYKAASANLWKGWLDEEAETVHLRLTGDKPRERALRELSGLVGDMVILGESCDVLHMWVPGMVEEVEKWAAKRRKVWRVESI